MHLLLDTASPEYFVVALAKPDGRWLAVKRVASHFTQSEKILPHIERLLQANKVRAQNVSDVLVVAGPGGFTSLRIGVITADALGFACHKPVLAMKTGEYDIQSGIQQRTLRRIKKAKTDSQAMPHYGRPPNITKPSRG